MVVLTAVLAVIFLAFALPAARSKPHDLPIGVVGPAGQRPARGPARHAGSGRLRRRRLSDEAALRDAIRDRDVYGGLVLAPSGPVLMTATGASPVVAQLLTQIGTGLAAHTGATLHTEDLAPLPARDPRGGGLAASALPLTLAGLLPAAVLLLVFPTRAWVRLAALVAAAVSAAVTVALLLVYVFGSVEHNLLGVTAGLTLGVLATGLALLGLGSMFGRVGLGVGSAVAMLIGNPLSGLSSAPEMLPRGWGAFGQLLPQGANATLVRSTASSPGPVRRPRSSC